MPPAVETPTGEAGSADASPRPNMEKGTQWMVLVSQGCTPKCRNVGCIESTDLATRREHYLRMRFVRREPRDPQVLSLACMSPLPLSQQMGQYVKEP
jgi:hypothetical protein